jgi:hypothetical protein
MAQRWICFIYPLEQSPFRMAEQLEKEGIEKSEAPYQKLLNVIRKKNRDL